MIVNLDGFTDAVTRARSFAHLPLGLHLNLTEGRPLTRASSLTRARGEFHSMPALLFRASAGLIQSDDVVAECAAQLDRMLEVGIVATHLDSHRHVHMHPRLFPAVAQAARSRGVDIVRVPREPLRMNAHNWRATLKKLALLGPSSFSTRGHIVHSADHFFGLSLQGAKSFAPRLFALIARLPAGTSELMVHPGHVDADLSLRDAYTWQREEELRVLCSPEFGESLKRNDVELASFRDLGSAPTRAH